MIKISRKIKKGLKPAIFALITAITFQSLNINSNAETNSYMLDMFIGANVTLYDNNDNVLATDTLTQNDIANETAIWSITTPNIRDYCNNYEGSTKSIYITFDLSTNINLGFVCEFGYYSDDIPMEVSLYNNDNLIAIVNNSDTNMLLNVDNLNFNSIYMQGFLPDYYSIGITPTSNSTDYLLGYNNGISKYNELKGNYDYLQESYDYLLNNYRTLETNYNQLARGTYTFENLFWSIGSVPMAVLLQTFNVNVLGMNIAAIITGLLTALVIIWLIKRLLK